METERKIWPIAVALAVVTFLVYSPLLTFGFVNYDDPQYVLNNPQVKNGLTFEGIAWAFSGRYATNWHPLTWISHMLVRQQALSRSEADLAQAAEKRLVLYWAKKPFRQIEEVSGGSN